MLLSDWLRRAQGQLERAAVESARLEAQMLAAHGLGKDRAWVLAHPEAEAFENLLEPLLARRASREPLAYILGYREFFGRRFDVTPDVLIPRQETETLVEAALDAAPTDAKVLDLGTGCGCVAISLAIERSQWEVWASDVSLKALRVAQRNAERLGATVQCVHSNLFAGLANETFDLIVSNPPYVEEGARLEPEIQEWEPNLALFGGPDGLDVYRRIASEAGWAMRESGILLVEVGDGMAEKVSDLFGAEGWREGRRYRDLSGVERVVQFRRNEVDGRAHP